MQMLVLQVQLAKESNQKFFSKKGVSLGHPFFVKGKNSHNYYKASSINIMFIINKKIREKN